MCLDTITKRYDPPDETVRKAYKILRTTEGGQLSTPFRAFDLATDEWITAIPARTVTEDWSNAWMLGGPGRNRAPYTAGFHCFATRKIADDALAFMTGGCESNWDVFEVEVRGVTCEGPDGADSSLAYRELNPHTLVAREMYVPRPRRKKDGQ